MKNFVWRRFAGKIGESGGRISGAGKAILCALAVFLAWI